MERILISACLLGCRCRYDGQGQLRPWVEDVGKRVLLVPVCPEQLGGLPTPRPPAECRDGRVVTRQGNDVTDAYCRGAREALMLAEVLGCRRAILQDRSPSCGVGQIYDGGFTRRLVPGDGVTARLLREHGLEVIPASGAVEALGLPGQHQEKEQG